MTLQQLRYMIIIAEKGSISEAAKTLFVTQPSLTNAIRELEMEFHITIFNRTNRGIILSSQGEEFMGYARQVVEQADLMEEKYHSSNGNYQRFQISSQHYSFVVQTFAELIKEVGEDAYEMLIRETRTSEIIEDVKNLKSEIGVLYLTNFNEKVLTRYFKENKLKFEELFRASPHIFISEDHPLAEKQTIKISELAEYPYLSFEQGDYNSFYFSEEMLSNVPKKKCIKVNDRATLFQLLVSLLGYTVSTGILGNDFSKERITARPLEVEEVIRVGVVTHQKTVLSDLTKAYLDKLRSFPFEEEQAFLSTI